MTPDDFPDNAAYLEYVMQCEDSISQRRDPLRFMPTNVDYWHWTEPYECHFADHVYNKDTNQLEYVDCKRKSPCPDHILLNRDGLGRVYHKGTDIATHCTSPMFTLKATEEDCSTVTENCSRCSPDNTEKLFNNLDYARRSDVWNIFDDLNGELEGVLKPESPDYELSVKASHP